MAKKKQKNNGKDDAQLKSERKRSKKKQRNNGKDDALGFFERMKRIYMKRFFPYKEIIKMGVCFVLIISLCSFFLHFFLQKSRVNQYRNYYKKYIVGMISEDDLFLTDDYEITDVLATEKKKKAAAAAVLPVFSYHSEITLQVISEFDKFISAVNNGKPEEITNSKALYFYNYIRDNNAYRALSLSYEVIREIMLKGLYKEDELFSVRESGYESIFTTNNYLGTNTFEEKRDLSDFIYTDFNETDSVNTVLNSYNVDLPLLDKYVIQSLVKIFCKANMLFDILQTETRKQRAFNEEHNVIFSLDKGMQLLKKDTVVTEYQMNALKLLTEGNKVNIYDCASVFVLNFCSAIVLFYFMRFFLQNEKIHFKQYVYIMLFFTVFITVSMYYGAFFAVKMDLAFIPAFLSICFLPMHLTMITGRRTFGSIMSLIIGLLVKSVPGTSYVSFIYAVVLGISGSFIVRFFNRRLDEILQWLLSILISVGITLLFMLIDLTSLNLKQILMVVIAKIFLCTVGTILTVFFLPIEERLFNLPTKYRLYELYYGESPLLESLNRLAPGTYSHSRAVADMAYSACLKIKANAFLARAGGLYHDIGKLEHSEFFVENQSGENKHDSISPALSVSIIKNHVKLGAEKAKEAHLPVEIIDIIANHHGTDIISFFYNEAKKKREELDAEVQEADYSYNNSKIPDTKECGVVMLADGIEAAARTIHEPNTNKFSKLIDAMVEGKFVRGQLNDCPLSMKEISIIKESFLRSLVSQHHARIEYPKDDEKK